MMETPFADDILTGAAEIAAFLYGDANERRRVFYLVETSRLPVFRMGSTICMRRSTWFAWVKEQEKNAARNANRAPRLLPPVSGLEASRPVDGEPHADGP